jgi:hypothetical protein
MNDYGEFSPEKGKQMRQFQQNSTQSTATLAPQQADLISALVKGATVTDATRQASIDRSTFYLWLKTDANFKAELNRALKEHGDFVRAQLRTLADTAVSTLKDALTGANVPAGVRVKAALAVLHSIGTLEPEKIGSTDPKQIESAQLLESMTIFP